MPETRTCESCKGTGQHPFGWRPNCSSCGGSGTFCEPDRDVIWLAIRGRKGLVSKRPKDGRAYYVWRMARFHGGLDTTMPVMASLEIHGDPWRPELDKLADEAAKTFCGTDLAAAKRWGRALGVI